MRISNQLMCVAALVLAACGGGSGGGGGTTTSGGEGVTPIPAGYHAITPSLVVTDVGEAIRFYEAAFRATVTERVEGPGGVVLHGEVRIGDSIVMLSPEDAERGQRAPTAAGGSSGSLFVYVEDVDTALSRATGAGAVLVMPAADMFWGDRYAQVRDAFGHRWSLATRRFDLSPEEIATRGQAFMAAMASGSAPPVFEGGPPAASWQPAGYFTVTPAMVVDGPAAIDFYVSALGATERERVLMPDGSLMHGEVMIGDSIIMLGGENPQMEADMKTPAHLGASTLSLMHYTADADALFESAVAAGATADMPPTDMFWGDRMGMVRDPSGHSWGIATHVRDVTPEEMAAAIQQMSAAPAEGETAPAQE